MRVKIKFYNMSGRKKIKEITHRGVERVEYTSYDVQIFFLHDIKRIIYNKTDIFTVTEEYDSD